MNKKTKNWLVVLIVILIIILLSGCFYLWQFWWPEKQLKIQMGLTNPSFPWKDYTEAEFKEKYPQLFGDDIQTRITPEETYTKFREALRTNNLELVLEQINLETGMTGKESEQFIREEYAAGRLAELYSHYPEKIEKANMYEVIAQYEYDYYSEEYKQNLIGTINFIKNADGDWKMDSL